MLPVGQGVHCCGNCTHAIWTADSEGECHGGWWEIPDQRHYHLPKSLRPTIKIRPFLMMKGSGSQCRRFFPLSNAA